MILPYEQLTPTIIVLQEFSLPKNSESLKCIINLNKPKGPTSHIISEKVKRLLGAEKAGHGGTLDPNATGVLPIAINKGTKVLSVLLLGGKKYVATMHLHKEVDEQKVREVLDEFIGKIKQTPPKKSAVKREEREREIYYIKFLEQKEKDVKFEVGCESGTYIRTLCVAIGEKLGTGAHLLELERTQHGPFKIKDSITLDELETKRNKALLPLETAIRLKAQL